METILKHCEVNKLECILGCKRSKSYYKLPHEDATLKIWLDKLGLDDIPSNNRLPRICNNHFTDDMFEADGRRLKQTAIPVTNIPVGNITENPNAQTLKLVQSKPKVIHLFNQPAKIKNAVSSSINSIRSQLNKSSDGNSNSADEKSNAPDERSKLCDEGPETHVEGPIVVDDEPKEADEGAKTPKGKPKQTEEAPKPSEEEQQPTESQTTIQKGSRQIQRPKLLPLTKQRAEIIVSRDSRCFLKCKDAMHSYQFPKDEASRKIWVERLGMVTLTFSSARLCRNHFSPRMFTHKRAPRLTRCAVPDINLPGQTIFTSVEGPQKIDYWPVGAPLRSASDKKKVAPVTTVATSAANVPPVNNPPDEEKMKEYFRAMLDPPFPIEVHPEISRPEILINPIENLKSAINQEQNKEGILHVFRPQDESKVLLPENAEDAKEECVLKCPNTEHLYKFPNLEFNRKIWLERVGLTHCYFNTMLCEKHFSEKMFTKSKKRLVKNAYPDRNLPKTGQTRVPKKLSDYRLVLPDHVCDVIELPEYICVLTVLKQHIEVEAPINGMKYVKHNINVNIPKREREVQVLASDMVNKANIGILTDDLIEDLDAKEDNDSLEPKNVDMPKSHQTKIFECLICGEISIGDDCQLKHSDTHKESSSLCFQCGRLFSSQIRLKMHEEKRHFGSQIRKALRCPKMHCKKAFHSKKQLLNHVEEHTKRSEHKCRKCKQVFRSALKLHSHQMTCRSTWWPKYPKRVHIRTQRN